MGDIETEKEKRSWRIMDYGVDWPLIKDITLPILERYTAHTNGSSLRLQNPGIAWSYYSTDPEWGAMQAKALILDLENVLQGTDVKVVHLKGMVELVPKELNKGVVLRYALEHGTLSSTDGSAADFILCIGDDASDEHMFTSINDYIYHYNAQNTNKEGGKENNNKITHAGHSSKSLQNMDMEIPNLRSSSSSPNTQFNDNKVYTCTVGKKKSHAAYFLPTQQTVGEVLDELARNLPN